MRRSLALGLMLLCGSLAAEVPVPANSGRAGGLPYAQLAIVEPATESTLRDNGGNLRIRVNATPRLQRAAGHRLHVLLDGKPRSPVVDKSAVILKNIDRGSHELIAVIVDENDVELVRSPPVTFYLHRRSLLHPNQKSTNGDQKATPR